jgi:hypothetical protein
VAIWSLPMAVLSLAYLTMVEFGMSAEGVFTKHGRAQVSRDDNAIQITILESPAGSNGDRSLAVSYSQIRDHKKTSEFMKY